MTAILEFFRSREFLIPFLSTVAASVTILLVEGMRQLRREQEQKLYAIAYMANLSRRLLQSSLILRKSTILPHIEAVKRILGGDVQLLGTMFDADDFDILTSGQPEFKGIPDDHKVLVGYDDIDLLQAFEFILFLNSDEGVRKSFNSFVAENLKSRVKFEYLTTDERRDILNRYWDYLDRLDHCEKRSIATIVHVFLPKVREFIGKREFLLYSKKSIASQLEVAGEIVAQFAGLVPDANFFGEATSGGVQRIVGSNSSDS